VLPHVTTHNSLRERFLLRCSEIIAEPSTKVAAGFVLATILGLALKMWAPVTPMWGNHRALGPEWECTYLGHGARVCDRDVPKQFQNLKPEPDTPRREPKH